MSDSYSLPTEPEGVVPSLVERFNSGEVSAMLTLYEPEAVLVVQDGRTVTGHTEIAAQLEPDLKHGLPLEAKARHVFVNGDIAEIVLDWSIDGTGRDGEHVHVGGSACDVVHRGADGIWRYVIDNNLGTASDDSPPDTGLEAPCVRPIQERCPMKAIVVTDEAAGTAGMTLAERPEPEAAGNDVLVEVHASGFTPGELTWPSTWTDRLGRDRTPSIPGHELAGVVSALGYGTTGLSVGQRVFGLTDWTRDGTLAEYAAVEARNLAPLPGDVDFTVGASLPISGLTAWQGLFEHGRLQPGQSVLVHGAAGGVGSMVTQLAREAGAYVIGTGRAADRQAALDFGAKEFVDLDNDPLEDVGGVDLVFDVIGGDIGKRSAGAGSRRRNTGDDRRPAGGTAHRRPGDRLRRRSPIAPNSVRSSSGCGTDVCGRSSATSRPSMTPLRRSIRPSGSREKRSSAFARKCRERATHVARRSLAWPRFTFISPRPRHPSSSSPR